MENSIDGNKIIQFLNEKWKNAKCPMCGAGNWNVDPHVVTTVSVENRSIQLGGRFFPLIPVTCMNCGNTIFVNAIVCGVWKNDEIGVEENNGNTTGK